MTTDTITVRVANSSELEADAATLLVVVEGSSIFSGAEAFKKAKELQSLVALLKDVGIEQDRIKLRSVELNSQSFALIKTSSARYVLSIKTVPVERLPDTLGAIASHKGAKLTELEWVYEQVKAVRQRLRRETLSEALQQARIDAEVLGVQLLGVHETVEESIERPYNPEYVTFGEHTYSQKFMKSPEPLGLNLGNSTTVKIALKVSFRVGPLITTA